MKFGELLQEGVVPEWRDQYVDYLRGKKLIKKVKECKQALDQDKPHEGTPLVEPQQNPSYTEEGGFDLLGDSALPSSRHQPHEGHHEAHARGGRLLWSLSQKLLKEKQEDYDEAQENFMTWLDDELSKVDLFYLEKEQEIYRRFLVLEDQLYQLKEHQKFSHAQRKAKLSLEQEVELTFHFLKHMELPSLPLMKFLEPLLRNPKSKSHTALDDYDVNYRENLYRNGEISTDEEILEDELLLAHEQQRPSRAVLPTGTTAAENAQAARIRNRRDYIKRKFGTPYHVAKRQLRQATFEFYRSLTLLRLFRILNRTAFRKITKKYDKTCSTSLCEDYMKVVDNRLYFQTLDLLDKLIAHVEDLFITFFEPRLDKKQSLEKLKLMAFAMSLGDMRPQTFYSELGDSSFALGFGIPLLVLAIYHGLAHTFNHTMPEGPYLLQIWGGFLLLALAFLMFAVNFWVFDYYKINYKFIFEYDMLTALNWKQYMLIPSIGFALLTLLAWFSLNNFWPTQFPGRYWPWIFWGIMMVVFIWPGSQMYPASRRWLQVAVWRILLSGLYPVEFRDFFLGDILCSLTYVTGNISFFFCVYAQHWRGLLGKPGYKNKCGSLNLRLMGFFSTLPSIFRWLQCLRRYMDTGDWFPHLANMLKYLVLMLYQILLSVYRINRTSENRTVFIVFASINLIYLALWDLMMDWLLLHFGLKNFLLRDHLIYPNHYVYYAAMILDVVLRFQWVFYACFSNQIQQLAATSFLIAVAELFRRFIWVFFRMENEHATNVTTFRALKNLPLPYPVKTGVEKAVDRLVRLHFVQHSATHDLERLKDLERVNTSTSRHKQTPSVSDTEVGTPKRRKLTIFNIGDRINKAHIKDFQRRKTFRDYSDEEEEEEDDDDDDATPAAQSPS